MHTTRFLQHDTVESEHSVKLLDLRCKNLVICASDAIQLVLEYVVLRDMSGGE